MMGDADGRVTTGLITATRFVKDNRLLPDGFDKRSAAADIAVIGVASEDVDFVGGSDRVRYVIDASRARAGSALRIEVELLYQPIAFRWARNLGRYDAHEVRRFTSFYDAMAGESSTILARTATTVRRD
jgi:TolB-like protein